MPTTWSTPWPSNTGEKLIIPAIQPAAENKRRMVSYRVRKGDTFLGIADRFSVEPEDLRKWNRLAANKVRRGMVLRVYTLDSTPERGARTTAKSGAKSSGKPVRSPVQPPVPSPEKNRYAPPPWRRRAPPRQHETDPRLTF